MLLNKQSRNKYILLGPVPDLSGSACSFWSWYSRSYIHRQRDIRYPKPIDNENRYSYLVSAYAEKSYFLFTTDGPSCFNTLRSTYIHISCHWMHMGLWNMELWFLDTLSICVFLPAWNLQENADTDSYSQLNWCTWGCETCNCDSSTPCQSARMESVEFRHQHLQQPTRRVSVIGDVKHRISMLRFHVNHHPNASKVSVGTPDKCDASTPCQSSFSCQQSICRTLETCDASTTCQSSLSCQKSVCRTPATTTPNVSSTQQTSTPTAKPTCGSTSLSVPSTNQTVATTSAEGKPIQTSLGSSCASLLPPVNFTRVFRLLQQLFGPLLQILHCYQQPQ